MPLKWFTHTVDSLGTSGCLNTHFFHITIDYLYFLFNINLPPYNKKKTKLYFFLLFWWKKRKLCLNFTPTQKKTPQQHGMKPATYVVVFVMMLMFFYPFRHSVPAPRAMGTRCENTFANILGKSRLSPIDISCLHSERKKNPKQQHQQSWSSEIDLTLNIFLPSSNVDGVVVADSVADFGFPFKQCTLKFQNFKMQEEEEETKFKKCLALNGFRELEAGEGK